MGQWAFALGLVGLALHGVGLVVAIAFFGLLDNLESL